MDADANEDQRCEDERGLCLCHNQSTNLQVINISDPSKPALASTCPFPGSRDWPSLVTVAGNRAYVASKAGLEIFDITQADAPVHLNRWLPAIESESGSISLFFGSVAADDHLVYLEGADISSESDGKLIKWKLDVTDPQRPVTISETRGTEVRSDQVQIFLGFGRVFYSGEGGLPGIEGDVVAMVFNENYAYVSGFWGFSGGGVRVFDMTDPDHPALLHIVNDEVAPSRLAMHGQYLYGSSSSS